MCSRPCFFFFYCRCCALFLSNQHHTFILLFKAHTYVSHRHFTNQSTIMQMITALLPLALLMLQPADAHGHVSDLKIGDKWYKGSNPYGDAYISDNERIVWSFWANGNEPIQDVSSQYIACNKEGKPAALTAPVKAGDQIDLFWTTWPTAHLGPVITYMANCGTSNCSNANPNDLNWFKIDEKGYDASSKTWASQELMKNNNSWSVSVPSNLKSGSYLLRHEILALMSANYDGGAQFYPMCTNLEVSGSGTEEPSSDETVKFPGAYKSSDKGIKLDIYTDFHSYEIPGPAVWSGAKSSSSASTASSSSVTSASAGAASSWAAAYSQGPTTLATSIASLI